MRFLAAGLIAFALLMDEPKPSAVIAVTPRFALAPINGSGVEVRATVSVHNGGEKFHCADVQFQWSEGNSSFESSDCEPYDPATDTKSWSVSRTHVYGPGTHEVVVTISKSGRKLRVLKSTVEISG